MKFGINSSPGHCLCEVFPLLRDVRGEEDSLYLFHLVVQGSCQAQEMRRCHLFFSVSASKQQCRELRHEDIGRLGTSMGLGEEATPLHLPAP